MHMNVKQIGRTVIALVAAVFLFAGQAQAGAEEYDPVTGEPRCTNCHQAGKSYSIDYSREESCSECHGPGLSDGYLEIDERYKLHKAAGHDADMDAYLKVAQAGQQDANNAKKPEKTGTSNASSDRAAPEDMVLVPAGEFTMGSDDWWPKVQPEHRRHAGAFYIDRFEVTNKRYKRFVDATGRPAPDHWKGGVIPEGRENHPVLYVTWYTAEDFKVEGSYSGAG